MASSGTRARWLLEPAPLDVVASDPRYPWFVVATVCIGAFMGQLDASIVTLVLPTLEQQFGVSLAAVEWVAIAYLLVLMGLVVAFGRLADIVGRKLLYTAGFLVFIAGSALCGLSLTLPMMIGARVLQAVGAAMLQANSVALITQAVGRSQLGRAIGLQGAAQAIGLSVGPTLGGLLIDTLGWQWIFFINVPAGLIGVVLAFGVLPRTAGLTSGQRFDFLGAALLMPTIALLLYALTHGNDWGWTSPATLLTALAGVLGLAGFLLAEHRTAEPVLDLRLFRHQSFSAGIAAGLLSYFVLFGALFVLPFLFERVQGRSATQTGLLLSSVPVALALAAPLGGAWTDRSGPRPATVAGMALSAIALLGLELSAAGPSVPLDLALLLVFGAGLGLFTPANNSAIMASAPRDRLGIAGGVLNMTRGLGTALGVAVTGAVLAQTLARALGRWVAETGQAPPGALLIAIQMGLLVLAIIAAASAASSLLRGSER